MAALLAGGALLAHVDPYGEVAIIIVAILLLTIIATNIVINMLMEMWSGCHDRWIIFAKKKITTCH